MGVYYEIACLTCQTSLDLGKVTSTGFSDNHRQFYAFLDQHMKRSCDLLACCNDRDSIWDEIKYDIPTYSNQDSTSQINHQLLIHFSALPANHGIRLYNQLGHFIEIVKSQPHSLSAFSGGVQKSVSAKLLDFNYIV